MISSANVSSLRRRQSDVASTDVLLWWWYSLATSHQPVCSGQHLDMKKLPDDSGQPRWGASRGLCHRSDDVFSDSCMRVEPGLNLSGSQEPAKCQQKPSADTHLLHMSILPLNPSKGFPESSSLSSGPPTLWCAEPTCFRGTEVITLWPGHVKCLIQMFEVLQGTLIVTIGHKPAH